MLLTLLLEARLDLVLTAQYMAALVTNSATGSIIRQKLAALTAKRDKSVTEIKMFRDIHLQDARAIREAINSGEYAFDEFMRVLEKAAKFKDWLRTRNPDANLLDEYSKSVMTETWLNTLPGKALRFVIAKSMAAVLHASGLGAAGVGLKAADNLLLDRLFNGWRPNQFVQGPLQRLRS